LRFARWFDLRTMLDIAMTSPTAMMKMMGTELDGMGTP